MAKGSSIQALYDLCKKTFTSSSSISTSPQAIKKLSALMASEEVGNRFLFEFIFDGKVQVLSHAFLPLHLMKKGKAAVYTITSAEVGLQDVLEDDRGHGFFGSNLFKNSNRTARWAQPITYLHIYECDSFTIGIFCLPTSSVIPLHDHPQMTVLSKILYGSMHVKAYDWIEPPCTSRSSEGDDINVRLAKIHTDTVLTAPCPTTVLYPKTGGNLHCFTAVSSCAVLDVLAPPYNEAFGRRCTYYHDFPYSSFSHNSGPVERENEEDYAWLEAVGAPDDLYMRSGKYTGPNIQSALTTGRVVLSRIMLYNLATKNALTSKI